MLFVILLFLLGFLLRSFLAPGPDRRPARATALPEVAAVGPVVRDDLPDEFPQTAEDAALLNDDLLYGPLLLASKEPSIARAAREGVQAIRLSWIRAERTSFTVRITHLPSGPILVANEVEDGEGLEGEPVVRRRVAGRISARQEASLDSALQRADFWALPRTARPAEGDTWCLVEASSRGRFHAVERSDGQELAELAMVMMRLSGLAFDPESSLGRGR